jgi:hypothetical protein
MLKYLFSIAIFSIVSPCFGQANSAKQSPVDFFKEEITLRVDDSISAISGTYYFRNNTENAGHFPVAFPFYVDSLSLYPNSMNAYCVYNRDTVSIDIRLRPKNNMAILNIPLKPNDGTRWFLDYTQKILSPKAVYIITSTASWGKPLEDATYRFIVPSKYRNVSVWPDADTVITHQNYLEYLTHKTNFMPWRDMEIKWEY